LRTNFKLRDATASTSGFTGYYSVVYCKWWSGYVKI